MTRTHIYVGKDGGCGHQHRSPKRAGNCSGEVWRVIRSKPDRQGNRTVTYQLIKDGAK